jgi:ammonium transporter, Amt family
VTEIQGGWLDGNYIQLAYQLCNCVVGISYSFVMTCIILFILNYSGLHLRVTEDEEQKGIDPSEIGYFAYDYIHEDVDVLEVDEEDNSDAESYNTNGNEGSLLLGGTEV